MIRFPLDKDPERQLPHVLVGGIRTSPGTKLVGYWKPLPGRGYDGQGDSLPDPKLAVGISYDKKTLLMICGYLDGGKVRNSFRGSSYCRFACGTPDHVLGHLCLTDGVWQWPSGLIHYVRHHDVQLPEEFLNHILASYQEEAMSAAEAFCLMRYATDDNSEEEWIWNSRDGVTSYLVNSKSGKLMRHVDYRLDQVVKDYNPADTSRVFVTMTAELAEQKALAITKDPKHCARVALYGGEMAYVAMARTEWVGQPEVVTGAEWRALMRRLEPEPSAELLKLAEEIVNSKPSNPEETAEEWAHRMTPEFLKGL